MISVAEALAIGTRHHQAGELAQAERIYRQILAVEPQQPQALHLLGMLALQTRQFDVAIQWISQAIRADRTQAAFHANLAEAYRHAGRLSDATDCVRAALKLQPKAAPLHAKLGSLLRMQGKLPEAAAAFNEALQIKPEDFEARTELGCLLQDQGKFTEAEACLRRVLRTADHRAEAHFNLGSLLQGANRLDEAAACYRAALDRMPDFAAARTNLGTVLKQQGALGEAAAHFQTALRLNFRDAVAHTNLGAVYEAQGRAADARAAYEAAVAADPRTVVARNSLGVLLQRQGKLAEAQSCLQEAVRIDPGSVSVQMNLGIVFQAQGKAKSAIECYREALRIDPTFADAYNNIGAACGDQGLRDESIVQYHKAIELNPNFPLAHGNLAVALQALGRLDESIVHHRRAVELNPASAGLHSNLLYALNYHPAYDAATLFAEHRAWGERHADPLTARAAPHLNDRNPTKRLRIGYLSPYFMAHAVNFFSEPILAAHDHAPFEIVCYADVLQPDDTTERLRGYADLWRSIVGLTDQAVSDLVRADQIDILVDLTGHIGGNRLLIFARKPAPIQVTYIGYQNTTGMLAMNYRLTDEYSDPPGAEAFHTEALVRLPRSFFCYLPSPDAPPISALPALVNGHITFGSFNNFSKITPNVLQTWGDLLARVPESRLLVLADMTASLKQYLTESFALCGVSAERLEFVHRLPRERYLELVSRADIALDPFPFNGHTTTCDALWQGVPVVTLSGRTYVERFGGSGLATLGLRELIADSRQQYVDIAAGLANDLERLGRLRANLRDRMAASPLLDFRGFTQNLEAAYRRMWLDWIAK